MEESGSSASAQPGQEARQKYGLRNQKAARLSSVVCCCNGILFQ